MAKVKPGRKDLGGVDRVRVEDDGSGMPAEHCEEYFRPIGVSWKKRAHGSPVRKRALHGKNGRGRVRAFALGTRVRWTAVSGAPGDRQQLVIEADRRSMDEFDIGDLEATGDPTGTTFEAFGGDELDLLADERARSSLTTLSALIKASTAAANRIDFLAALEHLVFAPEVRQRVTERDELHRILEDQCWVFGEEYAPHLSDRSLNAVLAEHCRLLGRDAPAPDPVLREDGRRARVDLMLSRVARHRKGERHHLVVELKRPSVVLRMPEFSQINSYAEAVMPDDRFREPTVTWDFWLVGNAMDKTLRHMAHQLDRIPGCAVSTPRLRIMVKTWGEIIEDCQERLRFHSTHLEYQSATEHAMDYLVRTHGDAVTELVAEGTVPGPRRADAADVTR